MRPRRSRPPPRSSGSTGSSRFRPRSRPRVPRAERGRRAGRRLPPRPRARRDPAAGRPAQRRGARRPRARPDRSRVPARAPARTPLASRKPAVRSAIGIPPARTGTASPGDACAVSSPARACATRSYAGVSASGPEVPNEVTRPTTTRGDAVETCDQSSSNRSARSLAKLCSTISALRRSRELVSSPFGVLRSTTIERLPRLSGTK